SSILPLPLFFFPLSPSPPPILLPYPTLFRSPRRPSRPRPRRRHAAHRGDRAGLPGRIRPRARRRRLGAAPPPPVRRARARRGRRSEEHTSELQSRFDLVCRLLLEQENTHLLA